MPSRIMIWLTLFATAMAYVEAALVVHLRQLYYADNVQAIFPLQLLSHNDLIIELFREVATIVMLIAVAILAERNVGRRFTAFVYCFGVWDLAYYGFLKVLIDWPQTWLEWDVLFLIPWPWFGPWITPAAIALLFVVWGGWILLSEYEPRFNWLIGCLFVAGALLGLTAFLLPAAPLLPQGESAFQGYVPDEFAWGLYLPGLLSMALGLFFTVRFKSKV